MGVIGVPTCTLGALIPPSLPPTTPLCAARVCVLGPHPGVRRGPQRHLLAPHLGPAPSALHRYGVHSFTRALPACGPPDDCTSRGRQLTVGATARVRYQNKAASTTPGPGAYSPGGSGWTPEVVGPAAATCAPLRHGQVAGRESPTFRSTSKRDLFEHPGMVGLDVVCGKHVAAAWL